MEINRLDGYETETRVLHAIAQRAGADLRDVADRPQCAAGECDCNDDDAVCGAVKKFQRLWENGWDGADNIGEDGDCWGASVKRDGHWQ